jgi:hypothetical protein
MTISVKNLTASVERGDGIGLLKRLQTMNASATPADRNHALKQLQELQMHNKEAIIHFVSRFRSHMKVLADTTLHSKHQLSDNELSTYFIDKLCANMSIVGNVRHSLLGEAGGNDLTAVAVVVVLPTHSCVCPDFVSTASHYGVNCTMSETAVEEVAGCCTLRDNSRMRFYSCRMRFSLGSAVGCLLTRGGR